MKLLTDFFPVILFFLAYQFYGMYVATAVAIAASVLQVGYHWLKTRRLEKMHLATLAVLVVFGGLTLLLQDRTFIMWKPTVINWLFGLILLASLFVGEKPLIQRMMEANIELPSPIWRRVNLSWALFFILVGFLNLYVANGFFVAQHQLMALTGLQQIDFDNCGKLFQGNELTMCNNAHSLEQGWVNFKLFGILGLTAVFAVAQAFYLSRHVPDNAAEQEES